MFGGRKGGGGTPYSNLWHFATLFFPSFYLCFVGRIPFSLVLALKGVRDLVTWCSGVVAIGCCLHDFNEEHLYEDGQIKSPLFLGHI